MAVRDRAGPGPEALLDVCPPDKRGIMRDMSPHIARRAVVHGRVQGVWFRDSARHEAEQHGVTGWVRNRSDGTVEAWLEGEPAAVDAVVTWLHAGPPRAQVTHVDVTDGLPEHPSGFDVR
jgi:acylphosphatase